MIPIRSQQSNRLTCWLRLLLFLYTVSDAASGKDVSITKPFDSTLHSETVFTFGLTGIRHQLKSGNENQMIGNSAVLALGFGKINHTYMQVFTFDIIQGPFQPALDGQFDVDFEGTGISYTLAASAQETNLRSPLGSYGFSLGFSYSDIVGRSIGANKKFNLYEENPDLLSSYSMRVTQLSLSPGLFFAWLKPIRDQTMSKEKLMTRVEGYILTISASLPLELTYRSTYERDPDRSDDKAVTESFNSQENEWEKRVTTQKGQLGGFSIIIGFTALLGV